MCSSFAAALRLLRSFAFGHMTLLVLLLHVHEIISFVERSWFFQFLCFMLYGDFRWRWLNIRTLIIDNLNVRLRLSFFEWLLLVAAAVRARWRWWARAAAAELVQWRRRWLVGQWMVRVGTSQGNESRVDDLCRWLDARCWWQWGDRWDRWIGNGRWSFALLIHTRDWHLKVCARLLLRYIILLLIFIFFSFLLCAHARAPPNRSSGSVEKNVFKVVNKSFSLPPPKSDSPRVSAFSFYLAARRESRRTSRWRESSLVRESVGRDEIYSLEKKKRSNSIKVILEIRASNSIRHMLQLVNLHQPRL